ncbi:hypothetical protein ACOCEA_03425 [Maribacter sp. CXY002]|uniref:hypothetical protein n=1 Tax=Maribacter luteocoastalis TaxID=3407671 RepID=UPI003B678198
MAKFTITSMGLDQENRIMESILDQVSRNGKYSLQIKNNVEFEDLMANRLVQYKILKREFIKSTLINRGTGKEIPVNLLPNIFEYTEGDNFVAAKLMGAHKFIKKEKDRLNPSFLRNLAINMDKSNIISTLIGVIIGWLLTIIFS